MIKNFSQKKLSQSKNRGKIIVFEGIDGSGCETQTEKIYEILKENKVPVLKLSYPDYEGEIGKLIHDFLHKKFNFSVEIQFLLYFADFVKDISKINDFVKKGGTVLLNRYFTSTLAYQGQNGFDLKKALNIAKIFNLPKPDLIFYLDILPSTSIKRKYQEKRDLDRNESNKIFLKKVRDYYQNLAKKNIFGAWIKINGENDIDIVTDDILKHLKKIFTNIKSKNKFNFSLEKIAGLIDHTNIDPKATTKDIIKTCKEAIKYKFRGVDVNPKYAKLVHQLLKNTKIKTVVLIDPPMGQSPHEERVKMVKRAKDDGADEVDIVMNIIDLKYERYDDVLSDLREICHIMPIKVIIGSGYLTDDEIKIASKIVKEAGAICVKTATEKDPLDHSELKEKAKHLKLMRQFAPGLLIKASGKIKTLSDVLMMLEAGADIIGTSSSVNIMKEIEKLTK
ncbi:MAG: deoxyribose-phosphate aldolase [Minisyncoccia bacterium]